MKTSTKIWVIIAVVLLVAGFSLFAAAVAMSGNDINKLSTEKMQTMIFEFDEEISSIKIDESVADIIIEPWDGSGCKVECYEDEKIPHSAGVIDGVLSIGSKDNRKWYEKIVNISFESTSITVYIPKKEYERIEIDCSTGDVSVKSIDFVEIDVSFSTGKLVVENVHCTRIYSKGSTGNVHLSDVVATEEINIDRSTGDVRFDACDAGKITVDLSTGDVKGTLLTGKEFQVNTSTGDVNVPPNEDGGICQINTSTGDIDIKVKNNNK